MKKTLILMSAALLLLAAAAVLQGGMAQLGRGLLIGVRTFINVLPLLVAAFALSGLAQVLLDPQKVSSLLGKGSGIKGILLGALVGGIIPGGPYVYYPLAASFAAAGAETPVLITYITAKSLWDVSRIPMEVAIMGGKLTAIRYGVTFVFPFIAGFLTLWLFPGLSADLLPVSRKEEKA